MTQGELINFKYRLRGNWSLVRKTDLNPVYVIECEIIIRRVNHVSIFQIKNKKYLAGLPN